MPNLFLRGVAAASFCAAATFFCSLPALKQVKVTIIIAKKSSTNATHTHYMPELKYARLPDLSLLTRWRRIPNMLKSVAITIRHKTQATKATATLNNPTTPPPMETIQAMNTTPQAIA